MASDRTRIGAEPLVLLLPFIRACMGLLYGLPLALLWQLLDLSLDAFLVILGCAAGAGGLWGAFELAWWMLLGLGTSYAVEDGHLVWRRFGAVRRRVSLDAIEFTDVDALYGFADLFWRSNGSVTDPPALDVALNDQDELIELGRILLLRERRLDDFVRRNGIALLDDLRAETS